VSVWRGGWLFRGWQLFGDLDGGVCESVSGVVVGGGPGGNHCLRGVLGWGFCEGKGLRVLVRVPVGLVVG